MQILCTTHHDKAHDKDTHRQGCRNKRKTVDTDKALAHIRQESLIEALITLQYELRMKRFSLTLGRARD